MISNREKASIFALLGVAILSSANALGHNGISHSPTPLKATMPGMNLDKAYGMINSDYLAKVRPILQRSCYDCHSGSTSFPWYAQVPLLKEYIAADIAEARKHIDLSSNFPFGGHGSPREDLEAISNSVREGTMPPFSYRLMHRSALLSDAEKNIITEWASRSLALLRPEKN